MHMRIYIYMTNTNICIATLDPHTGNVFVFIPQWGPVELICPYVCLSVRLLCRLHCFLAIILAAH